MKRVLSIITLLLCITTMMGQGQKYGQLYVADHLTRDSIKLEAVEQNPEAKGNATIMVPNGDTLRLAGMDGEAAIVEYQGKQYKTYGSFMRFVSDNEAGDGNVAQDEYDERYHSAMGDFFYSPVPLIIIFVLLAVAGVAMLMVRRADTMGKALPSLATLMGSLLVASIVEAMFLVYTDDITWWCDSDSFWASLFSLLPAMLALAVQLYVGIGIKKKLEELTGSSLSLKTAFLSIPLALVLTFIVAIMHYGDFVQGTVFLATMAVCALYSWYKNGRGLGVASGLAYTLFNFVYALGAIIAVAVLLVLVWNMFMIVLPYLLMAAAAIVAYAFMSSSSGSSSGGGGYSNNGDQWTNIDGHWGTKHSDGSFTTGGTTYKRDGLTGEWKKK